MELNYKNLASAYLEVLEGYDFVIPEDVPANERTAFHGAAAAAHKAGKSHFDFGGKKYPVTMKKDTAKAINSEVQKEAKEDAEPEASSEVDGNDEKDSEAKKVPCPKCEGKGCAHCDGKGYHMSKVESSCGSDGKKSRKESVEESTIKELTAAEKKLVNQMYNKDGTLTDIGKKVMNYGKKPGDKGYIESTNEDTNFVPHSNCPCGDNCNCDPCTCAEVKEEAQVDEKKGDLHLYNNEADARKKAKEISGKVIKGTGKSIGKWAVKEEVQLDEKKTDIYHKHMLKALGKSRLPKDHSYTSAIANNGDFVVKDGGGRIVGRIAKGDHNLKEAQLDEISRSMTPMRNRFGGTVDPKKFDKYKKHMKTHKLDEPTVRMIHQNPDDAESKRMMKNPKYAQAVGLYKASMKEEVEQIDEISQDKLRQYYGKAGADLQRKRDKVAKGKLSMLDLKKGQNRVKGLNRAADKMEEKKLTPKDIKRALASIKPPKKKPTLPKAPFEIPKENTMPAPEGGKKRVRSADKRPVNVNVDGKTITRMEPVIKRTAAAYESVNRENWLDALQNKKLQEAEDAKTKTSKPTGLHHSDDATRDTYDKQLSTRKGEQDFVKMHDVETPEYADVNRVLPKTFAAFTAGVKAGGGKTNDAPGDKGPVKSGK